MPFSLVHRKNRHVIRVEDIADAKLLFAHWTHSCERVWWCHYETRLQHVLYTQSNNIWHLSMPMTGETIHMHGRHTHTYM